jgi:hypothetical protein
MTVSGKLLEERAGLPRQRHTRTLAERDRFPPGLRPVLHHVRPPVARWLMMSEGSRQHRHDHVGPGQTGVADQAISKPSGVGPLVAGFNDNYPVVRTV